jgi:DNA/RNA-binding domain of Phe-tRNA-synthetase-like protein
MYFCHSTDIWRGYPELVPGVVFADGITATAAVGPRVAEYYSVAESRLAATSEGELPEIQAWRRAFSRMGLKPTQYRARPSRCCVDSGKSTRGRRSIR